MEINRPIGSAWRAGGRRGRRALRRFLFLRQRRDARCPEAVACRPGSGVGRGGGIGAGGAGVPGPSFPGGTVGAAPTASPSAARTAACPALRSPASRRLGRRGRRSLGRRQRRRLLRSHSGPVVRRLDGFAGRLFRGRSSPASLLRTLATCGGSSGAGVIPRLISILPSGAAGSNSPSDFKTISVTQSTKTAAAIMGTHAGLRRGSRRYSGTVGLGRAFRSAAAGSPRSGSGCGAAPAGPAASRSRQRGSVSRALRPVDTSAAGWPAPPRPPRPAPT